MFILTLCINGLISCSFHELFTTVIPVVIHCVCLCERERDREKVCVAVCVYMCGCGWVGVGRQL